MWCPYLKLIRNKPQQENIPYQPTTRSTSGGGLSNPLYEHIDKLNVNSQKPNEK